VVQRCVPYTWLTRGVRINLFVVALRPQLVEYLNALLKDHNTVFGALQICRTIGVVGYRDNDRTNLTSANLR